jgi:hypothetical protein
VALSDNPQAVYEVECYMDAHTGSQYGNTINNVYSLEYCMDLCNAAGPTDCTVAYWVLGVSPAFLYECILYPTSASDGGVAPGAEAPNGLVFNGVRTARLLTSVAPLIYDMTYLLAPSPQYNLGLCTGPNANYYDRVFIGVYHQDNSIRPTRYDTWYVSCLGYSFYQSGDASSLLNTTAAAQTYGVGLPQTADDCARLCDWINYTDGDGGNNAGNCRLWHWMNTGVCNLYYSRGSPSTLAQVSGVVAAGMSRSNTGSEYTAYSYKRSLPPGVGPSRKHVRDTLAETDPMAPDAIIHWDKHKRRRAAARRS